VAFGQHFHPEHFTCDECARNISKEFYQKDGRKVCGSCRGRNLVCAKCGQGITTQEYAVVDGNNYHKHCTSDFGCAKCGQMLTGQTVNALGRNWHQRCFTCSGCAQVLGMEFFEDNGGAYCGLCAEGVIQSQPSALSCHLCGRSIPDGKYTTFEGRSYHDNCFRCPECNKILGSEFWLGGPQQDKPYCFDCAKKYATKPKRKERPLVT